MGQQQISRTSGSADLSAFIQELLADVRALEEMLNRGMFEKEPVRLGAEQELFLVDRAGRASCINTEVLRVAQDPRLSTELAQFNLEANLTPVTFTDNVFDRMEEELSELVTKVRSISSQFDSRVLLTGILPTLSFSDLTLDKLTNVPRYHQLNTMLSRMRRTGFLVHIKGLDELQVTHDNMLLESCNTSFQLHMQVAAEEFVDFYNIAQLISAPVLAAAVNSPLLFGKKLWAETRLALFQHSVDERSAVDQMRDRSPRVFFGNGWLEQSIVEIFRQDIARFRVLLIRQVEEDPMRILAQGGIPRLNALSLHNGTIWRWNRACYGILNGQPHLRIESRFLPSGPTLTDEIANAAFFCGLMVGIKNEYGRVSGLMKFEEAKRNFFAAARHGLDSQLNWVDGKMYPSSELILKQLLPLARAGLESKQVGSACIERYLGIIQERVCSGRNGAQWILKTFDSLDASATMDMRLRALTNRMLEEQGTGKPVHEWSFDPGKIEQNFRANYQTVGQYMSTALFTLRPDDIVDYAASIMHWEHIRHLPVEDEDGLLVGLVTQRNFLAVLAQGSQLDRTRPIPVRAIMKTKLITVTPETTTAEAIRFMKQNQIGCLPVLKNGKLVGIVTTYDILEIASKLLDRTLMEPDELPRITS